MSTTATLGALAGDGMIYKSADTWAGVPAAALVAHTDRLPEASRGTGPPFKLARGIFLFDLADVEAARGVTLHASTNAYSGAPSHRLYWPDAQDPWTWLDLATLTPASDPFTISGDLTLDLLNPGHLLTSGGKLVIALTDETTAPGLVFEGANFGSEESGAPLSPWLLVTIPDPPPPPAPPPGDDPADIFDWTTSRTGAFRYVRVAFASRNELEELDTIQPGGRITQNLDTELVEEGSLPAVGLPDLGDDLLRIYYKAIDSRGTAIECPLATMHAVQQSGQFGAAAAKANLSLLSALTALQEYGVPSNIRVEKTQPAVATAAMLCAPVPAIGWAGVPLVVAESDAAVTADADWQLGTSMLKIMNYLLEFADFRPARPDAWGRVVMTPYQDPQTQTPTWSFVDGENCIFLPDVSTTSDAFHVPNVVQLTCSNADQTLNSFAVNIDPASKFSLLSRGRPITLSETVTDVKDQATLDARCAKRLKEVTAAVETVVIKHPWVPISLGDLVSYAYSHHGLAGLATVQSREVTFSPSAMTTTTLRKVQG